jgi:16S rRNA (uracil1498-N3)-methyltransferase
MRITRIYSPATIIPEQPITLSGNAARHVIQVLRMGPGDSLLLFDGSGYEYPGTIKNANKSNVEIEVGRPTTPSTESLLRITLWHGLCRTSRMDSVVQKATELGAAVIQPVTTEFGVIKLEQKRALKETAHWSNVAISACEQSGRTVPPIVLPPAPLASCLDAYRRLGERPVAVMLDPSGAPDCLSQLDNLKEIIVLTGPEGGFSEAEKAAATAAGFRLASAGPRILRTETAPVVALTLIHSLLGDLRSAR